MPSRRVPDDLLSELDPVLRAVARAAPDFITLLDRELRIRFVNRPGPGAAAESLIGSLFLDLVPAGRRDEVSATLERVLQSGGADGYQTVHAGAAGHDVEYELRLDAIVSDGDVHGVAIYSSDMTTRREAQSERDRFFELSQDLLAIIDGRGRPVRVNPALIALLGLGEAELRETTILDHLHPDDVAATLDRLALRSGSASEAGEFNNRLRRHDGDWRHVSWRSSVDPVSGLLYSVGRDVTEQVELQRQLVQAQKMEAVGQLAGGVAHDFNNLLQTILGNAREAMASSSTPKQRADALDEIVRAAKRGARRTRQLLAFSRPQPIVLESIDVAELIERTRSMIGPLLPDTVTVQTEPHSAIVRADAALLDVVMMNLCVNARDAMPAGGELTLSTRERQLDDDAADEVGLLAGAYASILVQDQGSGISDAVRAHVFEPFFTTKDSKRGTGLGLSATWTIVQQHGGAVVVRSEPGEGAVFEVLLPLAAVATTSLVGPDGAPVRGGDETVLVAEDSATVRWVVARTLERAGYRVLVAEDGRSAIALFAQHREEIDVALLDVMMPGIGGIEAANELRALREDLALIFTTGFSEYDVEDGALPGPLLFKPYEPDHLLATLRSVLDDA